MENIYFENGILNKDLFTQKELDDPNKRFRTLIYAFNKIAANNPSKLDQLSYVDFYQESDVKLDLKDWIEFLSDYRVSMLLDKLMMINMRSNVNKILQNEDKSVASSQKLSSALTFLSKYFEQAMQRESIQYVYTSVPLTESEKHARNARVMYIEPQKNPHNPGNLVNRKKK